MSQNSMSCLYSARAERGIGLIELMISLAIASVLVLGLVVVAGNTQRTYSTQTDLAANNDKERFAAELLGNAVQSAGYFVSWPTTAPFTLGAIPTASAAFAAEAGSFPNPGQVLGGQTGGSSTAPDILNVRFLANPGDTHAPSNCQGGTSQAVGGVAVTYESQFAIVNNNLVCNVGTGGVAPGSCNATPLPSGCIVLIDGVSNMKILYGVDTQSISSASEYLPASSLTAGEWGAVRSVMITLTFTTKTSSPQTYSQVIQVMYETKHPPAETPV